MWCIKGRLVRGVIGVVVAFIVIGCSVTEPIGRPWEDHKGKSVRVETIGEASYSGTIVDGPLTTDKGVTDH